MNGISMCADLKTVVKTSRVPLCEFMINPPLTAVCSLVHNFTEVILELEKVLKKA